jgi:chromosome segregation ATPase
VGLRERIEGGEGGYLDEEIRGLNAWTDAIHRRVSEIRTQHAELSETLAVLAELASRDEEIAEVASTLWDLDKRLEGSLRELEEPRGADPAPR